MHNEFYQLRWLQGKFHSTFLCQIRIISCRKEANRWFYRLMFGERALTNFEAAFLSCRSKPVSVYAIANLFPKIVSFSHKTFFFAVHWYQLTKQQIEIEKWNPQRVTFPGLPWWPETVKKIGLKNFCCDAINPNFLKSRKQTWKLP